MEHQRQRLRYLLRDEPASCLLEWGKLDGLSKWADLSECQETIDLELEQFQIRISVVQRQLAYMKRMYELDALSGGNVFSQGSGTEPTVDDDGGKRA